MPLPKIRNGQKLSVMFPAEAIHRLKIEAMERNVLPSMILLEALDAYWDGDSEASNPTTSPTTAQRKASARLLRHLETLIIEGKLAVAEIASAAGVSEEEFQDSWRKAGYVPMVFTAPVINFLASKKLPIGSKI